MLSLHGRGAEVNGERIQKAKNPEVSSTGKVTGKGHVYLPCHTKGLLRNTTGS